MADSVQFNIQAYGSQQVVNDINKLFDALSKATAQQIELNKQIDTLRDRSKGNSQNRADLITSITGDPNKSREALKTLRKQLADLEKQLADLGRTASTINILPAGGPISRQRQEIERLTVAYANLTREQRRSPQGQSLLDQIRAEARDLQQALAAVERARREGGGAGAGGANGSGGLLGNFGATLGNIAKFQLASKVIDTVITTITYAEEVVRNFEAEVVNLLSLLGGSGAEDIKLLESEALRLGRTTAFTATEVVKLQQELVKLGFSAGEVILVSDAVVNFATAVRESADRVAELTGSTIKSFNLSVLESTRVVDVLTQATLNSALSFGYLETAMPTVASAAEEAGVSLDDLVGNFNSVTPAGETAGTALEVTAAVLGVLADRGVKASTSATAFRNILIESAQRGYTFVEALELINSSQNKLSTAFDLFGKRGAVQALILAANLDEVRAKTQELTDGVDRFGDKLATARSVADTQLTSIQGKVTLLKSAWDGFLLTIGNTETYQKASKGFLSAITDMLNGTSALIDGSVTLQQVTGSDSYLKNLLFGAQFFAATSERAGQLATKQLEIEQVLKSTLEDQGRLRQGIFAESNRGLAGIKEQRMLVHQVAQEYIQLGKTVPEAYKLADEQARRYITTIKEVIKNEKQRQEDAQLDLTEFTVGDIRGINRIERAKQIIQALEEQSVFLDQTLQKSRVEDFSEKLKVARARLKELQAPFADVTTGGKKFKTEVEELTSSLSKLEKQLKSAKNDTERFSILEKIEVTQAKIDAQEEAFKKFVINLSSLAVKNSSDAVRKEYVKNLEERLKIEEAADVARAKARITSEKELEAEIARINALYAYKRVEEILKVTKETDAAYTQLKSDLAKTFAEAFNLSFKVQSSGAIASENLRSSQVELNAQQLITDETERQAVLANNKLVTELNLNAIAIAELEAKKKVFEITNALTKSNNTLTKEEQTQLNLLKSKNEELEKAVGISNDLLALNFEGQSQSANIDFLTDVNALYAQYQNGEILPITGSLVGSEGQFKTAEDVLEERLRKLVLMHELAQASITLDQAEAEAERIDADAKAKVKLLEAQKKYNEADAKIRAEKNKGEQAEIDRVNKERERKQKKLAETITKLAEDFGSSFAEAMIQGDDIKDAFKELMKDLIDIVVNTYVAELSLLILKAIPTGNFAQIALATLGIAGLKAAGVGAKALIDRFEDGGLVKGPRHTNGGVKYRVKGTNYFPELEGEEFIMNRHATRRHLPLLRKLNRYKGYGSYPANLFGDGGLIGRTPQVLQPISQQQSSLLLQDDQVMKQAITIANQIAEKQMEVMRQQNEYLLTMVTDALNTNNRIVERVKAAKKGATL